MTVSFRDLIFSTSCDMAWFLTKNIPQPLINLLGLDLHIYIIVADF